MTMASSKPRQVCGERHERLRPSLPLVTRGDIQLLFFPSLLPPTPSTPPLNLYRRRTRFAGIGGGGELASRFVLSTKKVQPFRWSRHLYLARYSHERKHAFTRLEGRIPVPRGSLLV